MSGLSYEEALGQGWLTAIHPEDREALLDAWESCFREEREFSGENRIQTSRGTVLWGRAHVAPMRSDAGKVIGWVGTYEDITERKRAEEALRESEALLNEVGQIAKIGGWEMDLITRKAKWTRGTYDVVEIRTRRADPGPDEHVDYYLPQYRPMIAEAMWALIEDDKPLDFEAQLLTAKGNVKWCRAIGKAVRKGGKAVRLCGTFQDITERKLAEEALQESAKRFEATLDDLLEGCQVIGFDWRYVYVNDVAAWHGRRPKADLVGRLMTEVYPGIETTEMFARLKRCMEQRLPEQMENEFVYPDGTKAWFQLNMQPVPEGVFVLSLDITERKRVEEGRKLFRSLVDQSGDAIEVIDPQTGRFLDANEKACTDTGYSREEFLSLRVFDINPAVDPASHDRGMAELRKAGSLSRESVHRRKDGTTFPVEVILKYVQLDRDYIVGVARDVTERKRAEEALAHSQAQLSNALQMARAGHWEYSVARDAFTFNDNFYKIFRTTAAEVGGYEMSSADYARRFCHPDDAAIVAQEVAAAIEATDPNYSRQIEHRVLYANGEVGYITVRFFIVKDSQGRTVKTYGVNQDISERKALEAQLVQSQKMEAVGRLAGGIAHDFNNLLTGIRGFADFAREEAEPASQACKDLIEVVALADRAANLTRQLLAFSRRQALEPLVLNVNALIADQTKMLTRLLGEDIDVRFAPSPDLGNVRADPGQIEQTIMNLAVNSRDAMADGGRLTIETANVELGEEYTRAHMDVTPGPYVMIAVSDTGCGMDEHTQQHLFEPFFTTKEQGKGTGLGLSTVYGIVKQHGGNIWVYSEPGKGKTFKIYLPRVVAEAQERHPPSDFVTGGSETILLVEDNDAVRDVGRRYLEGVGYTVLCAPGAREAEELAARHKGPIALLLTDVVMPEIGGRELSESLAAAQPGLKVLYTSGYTDNAIVHQGVLEEGIPFLQKPFEQKDLAAKVRQVLEG